MNEVLDPPKVSTTDAEARFSTLPSSLKDDYRKRLGELIKLSDDQKRNVKAWLKKRIEEWRQDTEELHQRLRDDNDLCEGYVDETDFPFEGCSNVHIPITEMYMEVYKSVEKRSILGADLLWSADTDLDELKDITSDVEEMMNYKAEHEWNIKEALGNVFWTTNRDGLGAIKVTWAEDYEKTRDILIITNELEFLDNFPSPEDAGISEDEYANLRNMALSATEDLPLEIPVTFERQTYYGCKADVVELVNFVTIPAWVTDIKDESCRGYGQRYWNRGATIRKKASGGIYYEDAVKRLLNKPGKSELTTFVQAQDEIEGLGRTNLKDHFELFELVIQGTLDWDGDREENAYLVTYSAEHDELIQMIEYPYRVDFYALFRINERPNRLIGRSIPVKTRDMNDEIDTQHNQRINSRTIGTIPSFKAQNSIKKTFDPKAQENRWRPGVIFWLDNFDAFEQFKVQPTDMGESLSEETNDMKILDLYLGSAVALLSGGAAPTDPNAPGNKTVMMIQQSNLRMDDPLSDLRKGVSDLGDICLSHLYQFGPPILEFQSQVAGPGGTLSKETRSVHKKYLRKGIHMNMAGVTVTQNPEAEMQKATQIHQLLMSEPLFQQSAELRINSLRNILRAGRIPGRDKLLPNAQEIQAMQIDLQKKAMMQMQMEQEAAAAKQAADAQKARLDQAAQAIRVRNLAKKTAEMNLGEAPMASEMPAPAMNGASLS